MNWQAEIESRLARSGADPDPDIVLELAQHAAAAFERARADGLDRPAATARVLTLIDAWCADPAAARRRPRRTPAVLPPAAPSRGFTGFAGDLRYGFRQLRRQPGFAATAILVSALGTAAATTIFSVAYGVLMRPLPWPDADRLVRITETREGSTRRYGPITTNATYLAWKDNPATLESLAAYGNEYVTLGNGDDVERVLIVRATAGVFGLLGARPEIGALFTAADERPGGGQVVVISHRLWQRRFGMKAGVVGQSLDMDGTRYTIVGVLPDGFYFPEREVDAWAPRWVTPVLNDSNPASRSISLINAIGRLKPGITPAQASADGTARSRGGPDLGMVGIAMFGTKGAATVTATRYLDAVTADVQPALKVLLWAVFLLVATGTANVAGMQLARALGRRRELAVRSALGAGAGRLVRHLLTESAVIGFAGGAVGLALAFVLHKTLPSMLPSDFPRLDDIALDWRAAALAIGIAFIATLVFGLIPAQVARRQNLVETLTEDSLAPVGAGWRSTAGRLRALVMIGQVAVAAMLLIGASLLTRSFVALMSVDRGYNPHGLLTAEIPLPERSYKGPQRAAFLDDLVERLRAVPGVTDAAAANTLPLLGRDMLMGFGMPPPPGSTAPPTMVHASVRDVSPGYVEALGLRLIAGRSFQASDSKTSGPVVMVSNTFVSRYLTGNPIGQQLPVTFDQNSKERVTVVGVVEDVLHGKATDPPQPIIFSNYRQLAKGLDFELPMIMARTTGDAAALAPVLERMVRDRDPSVRPQSVRTMDDRLGASLSKPRLYALLLGGFAGFAVLVSGIGLFGVLSYGVTQRRREMGVRAALGARPRDLVALVVRQSLGLTAAGVVIGVGAAWLLSRQLGTLLYGITTHDGVTFGLVPIALLVTAVVACLAPARRAAKVDPVTVLK